MQTDFNIKVSKLAGNLAGIDGLWREASAALAELLTTKAEMFKLSFGSNYPDTFKFMANVSIRSAVWFVAHTLLKGRAFGKTLKGAGRSQVGQATASLVSEMNLFLGKGSTGTIAIDMASIYLAPLMCFGKNVHQNEIMEGGDPSSWRALPVSFRWVGSIGAIPLAILLDNGGEILVAYDNWLQNYIQLRKFKSGMPGGDDSKTRTRQQYQRLINAVSNDAKVALWKKVSQDQLSWESMEVNDESAYLTDDQWRKVMAVLA